MERTIEKTYICPFCGKKSLFIGVHDDEGNYHGRLGCEYEQDPWSGLSYALHHDGWGDCVLCTDGAYEVMGGVLFDTAQEAADAIPTLTPPNEWVSVEERLPEESDGMVLFTNGKAVTSGYRNHMFRLDGEEGIYVPAIRKGGGYLRVTYWMPLPTPPDCRPFDVLFWREMPELPLGVTLNF